MKTISIAIAVFAAIAAAAPAPAAEAGEPVLVRAPDTAAEALQKRACPAGSSCMNAECHFLNCSGGFCTWVPNGISC